MWNNIPKISIFFFFQAEDGIRDLYVTGVQTCALPIYGRSSSNLVHPCPAAARSYNATVLDIKLIRDRPDFVRERLATRGAGDEIKIDEVLVLDEQRRRLLAEAEGLKTQRNRTSKEIGALMGQKKTAEAEVRKAEMRAIGDKIDELDKGVEEAEKRREEILLRLPNVPHQSVPVGGSSADN